MGRRNRFRETHSEKNLSTSHNRTGNGSMHPLVEEIISSRLMTVIGTLEAPLGIMNIWNLLERERDVLKYIKYILLNGDNKHRVRIACAMRIAAEKGHDIFKVVHQLNECTEVADPELKREAAAALTRHHKNRRHASKLEILLNHHDFNVRMGAIMAMRETDNDTTG